MTWEMLGHEWAVNLLKSHIASDSVRHAYLFTGPDSVGKRTLALRFAQALNCEAPPSPGEFCGECRACITISEQKYPDLHVVEVGQLDETVADDRVSNRASVRQEQPIGEGGESQEVRHISSMVRVKQIRLLQRQLALSPFEGRWRVALLLRFWEASESAANALLKTLEEPAPQVVMLLTARSTESLLPTIVSRCEVVPLRAIAQSELEKGLISLGESRERAHLLAGLAAGRPGFAFQLQGNPEWMEQRRALHEDLFSLLKKNRVERFNYATRFRQKRNESTKEARARAVQTLEIWLSLWRDIMISALGAEASVQNEDRRTDIERIASKFRAEQVVSAVQSTERTLRTLHQYANVQLAMENHLLDLPKIMQG
jgi:DNA polymerase-3 subunit delta'